MVKTKLCTKGYSCGLTCINRERSCSKELTGQSIQLCSQLASLIQDKPRPKDSHNIENLDRLLGDESDSIKKALNDYTTFGYKYIREADRDGSDSKTVEAIYSYLQKAPIYDGDIYRGLSVKRDDFKVGSELEMDAISSFSSNLEVAKGFTYNTTGGPQGKRIVLKIQGNTKGCSIRQLSKKPDEDEVLVPKGIRYQIISKEDIFLSAKDDYTNEPIQIKISQYNLKELKRL